MGNVVKYFGWMLLLLMTGLPAYAEPDGGELDLESSFERGSLQPRRGRRSSGEAARPDDRQRAAVEAYLDRGAQYRDMRIKKFERRWGKDEAAPRGERRANRYAEPRDVETRQPPRYNRYWENGDRRYIRGFDDGGAPSYYNEPPPRPYNDRGGRQAYRANPVNSPTQSPNYPFDAPPSNWADSFRPEPERRPSGSRQALLKVKQWMRGENDGSEVRGTVMRDEEEDIIENPALGSRLSARVGLAGGMSRLSSEGGGDSDVPANFYLGLVSDVTFSQYFGASLDGFYGIAPPLTEEIVDADGNVEGQSTRSNQHRGVMADAYVRYPIPFSSYLLVPRLGLGYGYLGVTAKAISDKEEIATQSVNGVYYSVGADVIISDSVSLGIDYAKSLTAAGGLTQSTDGRETAGPIDGAGFSRFRVGAYVKVYGNLSLGAQYVQRTMSAAPAGQVTQSGGLQKQNESLSQFLGLLIYQL